MRDMTKAELSRYHSDHRYLTAKYGKATHCSNVNCQAKNPKRYERALIRGRPHSKNIDDYIELCSSCHKFYDQDPITREKIRKTQTGQKRPTMEKPVKRIGPMGGIKIYRSLTQAAKSNNIKRTALGECLRGTSKTSGGYKWEYINKKST